MKFYTHKTGNFSCEKGTYYVGLDFDKDIVVFVYENEVIRDTDKAGCYKPCIQAWREVSKETVINFNPEVQKYMSKTLEEIKKEFEDVKSKFLNKKIKHGSDSYKVESVDLFVSEGGPITSNLSNEEVREQGYSICVRGNSFTVPYKKVSVIEEIIVNGYIAEDKGIYYKFGCAEIDKKTLKAAKDFLNLSPGYGNKTPQSVKIGEGEFTLAILNKMSLPL